MSEKQFQIIHLGNPYEFVVKDNTTNKTYGPFEGDEKSMSDLLNEQQFIIEELKTHNLQHFLEWLVIRGYVTDEPMKDINNVIDCVNKFKEYLPVLNKITEINNEIGFDSDE